MRILAGDLPNWMLYREGAQTGAQALAFEKRMPFAAKVSKCGVSWKSLADSATPGVISTEVPFQA